MLCSQQDEKKQRPQYSNNSSNLMLEEAKTNHFLHLTIQHKTTASPKTIFIQANATKEQKCWQTRCRLHLTQNSINISPLPQPSVSCNEFTEPRNWIRNNTWYFPLGLFMVRFGIYLSFNYYLTLFPPKTFFFHMGAWARLGSAWHTWRGNQFRPRDSVTKKKKCAIAIFSRNPECLENLWSW